MTDARLARPPGPQRPAAPRRRRGWGSFRVIGALILREMGTRYGRSAGGYIWAIAEPVGAIVVITLAFSIMFRSPPIGTSFELFYATGILPFTTFTAISNRVSNALGFSRQLLSYPMVTYADALIARFLVTLVTQLLVIYLVFTGILVLFDTRAVLDLRLVVESVGMAAALGFGVGTLNAFLFLKFRTWSQVWNIISRPLLLVSGVLYLYGNLPNALQDVLWWNPLVHVVGTMRAGFYPSYDMSYVSPAYVIFCVLAATLLGLRFLSWSGKALIREG